jgi:hypothetical protein
MHSLHFIPFRVYVVTISFLAALVLPSIPLHYQKKKEKSHSSLTDLRSKEIKRRAFLS